MTHTSTQQRRRLRLEHDQRAFSRSGAMTAELIGQLAEELREPLDSIRATIRSAGAPPGANLQSAIAHCDQLEQKLSKLVSLQPAPPPALPVWRRKVAIVDIRAAVDAALSRFESPPAVDVLWDGADDPHAVVFADAELISRTLLYLIGQSIQATPRGGCVLVRVQSLQSREAIRWSVIDQGRGFQRAELEQRLATEASNQGAFGLNACRRVAALHHGALELYSRVDSGTEISFETSHFGPREFASNWTAWRLAQRGKEGQRISSTQLAPQDSDQQLRIDAAPARLSLLRAEGSPQYPGCVSIGTVALGATVSLSAANQFDRVLQHQLDVFDFAYRAGPRRWVWGLDADQPAAHYRTDSIDQTVCATLEGIRTTWANLGTVSVQPRQTLKRISDVLIHELLSESTPLGVADKDEVRLGSAPIEFSAETEQRLNQELRRLSAQLNRQTLRLRQQVHRLKEPVSKWS